MKNYICSILILAILTLCLIGCSQVSDDPKETTDSAVTTTTQQVTPSENEPDVQTVDPVQLLFMSVYELQSEYGEMFLECTENNDNSGEYDVFEYSVKAFRDIRFSYLTRVSSSYDEKLPNEVVLTEDYEGGIAGVEIGARLENILGIGWDSAWVNYDGLTVYQKDMGKYVITATAALQNNQKTEQKLLSDARGQITEIRLSRKESGSSIPPLENTPIVTVEDVSGTDKLKEYIQKYEGRVISATMDISTATESILVLTRGGGDNGYFVSDRTVDVVYRCKLSPPDGYSNPLILYFRRGLGGTQIIITARADKDGITEYFDYTFDYREDALADSLQPISVNQLDAAQRKQLADALEIYDTYPQARYVTSTEVDFDPEYMFERKFMDFTYDLGYLKQLSEDEEILVSSEKLRKWEEDFDSNYVKDDYPMLHLAIVELDIDKQAFMRVNQARIERGSDMALDERYVDILFLKPNIYAGSGETKFLLKHPLALYDGWETFVFEDSIGSFEVSNYPDVLERYVDEVERFCSEHSFTVPKEIEVEKKDEYKSNIVTDENGIVLKVIADADEFDEVAEYAENTIPYPYVFEITGLCTEVSFNMVCSAVTSSITAYGHTYTSEYLLIGNCSAYVFDAGGAAIFTWTYYNIGDTIVFTEDGIETLTPGKYDSLILRTDSDGALVWNRTNNDMPSMVQFGSLDSIVGYDTIYSAYGYAEIKNGEVIYHEPTEYISVADVLDLDEIFVKQGYSEKYSTIEELFEANRQRIEKG